MKMKALKPTEVAEYFKDSYPKANKKFNEDVWIKDMNTYNCKYLFKKIFNYI